MLSLSPATRVFVAVAPVDGRKSFNGLHILVKEVLQQDPTSGNGVQDSNSFGALWGGFPGRHTRKVRSLLAGRSSSITRALVHPTGHTLRGSGPPLRHSVEGCWRDCPTTVWGFQSGPLPRLNCTRGIPVRLIGILLTRASRNFFRPYELFFYSCWIGCRRAFLTRPGAAGAVSRNP